MNSKYFTFLTFFLLTENIWSVTINFDIEQVPKYYTPLNDDLYIAGSFNNWVPNDSRYKLTRVSNDRFALSINLDIGIYQYKFTRGSWGLVETSISGAPIADRTLTVNQIFSQTVKISILNWDDMKGRHTGSGNLIFLDRVYQYPQFNNTKKIWVYLPADYFTSNKYYGVFINLLKYSFNGMVNSRKLLSIDDEVMYMHDGQNLFDDLYSFMGEWAVDEYMEKLFQTNGASSIIVGIQTADNRIDELTPFANPSYGGGKANLYLNFITNNLKPYIDQKFRTKSGREFTGIMGSSLGGLFSFYAGLKSQETFSKIGVFSPSFWYSDEIYNFALNTIKQYDDIKFYFMCGGSESQSMVPDMNKMVNIMKANGFDKTKSVVQADGNHQEWFWKREYPAAYNYLFQN